jgi:hypothetical protein
MDVKLKLPDADAPGFILLQIEIARWRKRVQKYLALKENPPSIDSPEFVTLMDEVERFWNEFAEFARPFIAEPVDLDGERIKKLLSLNLVNQIFKVISGDVFDQAAPPLSKSPSSEIGQEEKA